MPYTPDESLEALKHFYRAHGERLWGPMGFYDAFNLTEDWFATSYLAIDQGPILCMIENHRSRLLWDLFMQTPELEPALDAIGFEPDSTSVGIDNHSQLSDSFEFFPNPTVDKLIVQNTSGYRLMFSVTDVSGVPIGDTFTILAGGQDRISLSGLAPGIYVLIAHSSDGGLSAGKICKLP
jgi:hypothetical protein